MKKRMSERDESSKIALLSALSAVPANLYEQVLEIKFEDK